MPGSTTWALRMTRSIRLPLLSALRQMVGDEGIDAIVPDLSPFNNAQFLASSKMFYVGYAFDDSYCTSGVSQPVWGFGYNGLPCAQ